MVRANPVALRSLIGRFSMRCWSIVVATVDFPDSISSTEPPSTLTTASAAPISIFMVNSALWPTVSLTGAIDTFLKVAASAMISYSPGDKAMNW